MIELLLSGAPRMQAPNEHFRTDFRKCPKITEDYSSKYLREYTSKVLFKVSARICISMMQAIIKQESKVK